MEKQLKKHGVFEFFDAFALLRSPSESPPDLPPSYNVAPTQKVLVAREHDGKREGCVMRWGLIPSWAKDKKLAQTNARADSASRSRCSDPRPRNAAVSSSRMAGMSGKRAARKSSHISSTWKRMSQCSSLVFGKSETTKTGLSKRVRF